VDRFDGRARGCTEVDCFAPLAMTDVFRRTLASNDALLAQGLLLGGRRSSANPNADNPRRVSMSYKIIASQCTGCSLCEFECPNAAISMKGDTFVIDPKKCTECEGHFDHAKCDEVCPVPGTCVKA
jgi:ferredoxin